MITERDIIKYLIEEDGYLGEELLQADTELAKIMFPDGRDEANWPDNIVDLVDGLRGGFETDEVSNIFVMLEVESPDERLEWFNRSTLDLADIVKLANVDFWATTCDNWDTPIWEGRPDDWGEFQGVWDQEICHVEGDITLGSVDVNLCEECVDKVKRILNI